jgi:hypothetical protein
LSFRGEPAKLEYLLQSGKGAEEARNSEVGVALWTALGKSGRQKGDFNDITAGRRLYGGYD